jgi:hypothetical protein
MTKLPTKSIPLKFRRVRNLRTQNGGEAWAYLDKGGVEIYSSRRDNMIRLTARKLRQWLTLIEKPS